MSDQMSSGLEELHRRFAKSTFNLTWDLLDKEQRSQEDEERMIHAAHASRFHWGEIGTPLQFARGEWQISRAYAVLGRAEPALHHAERCLAICRMHGIADFDLAFAYEAVARAEAVAGNAAESQAAMRQARQAAFLIADQDDKAYVLGELSTVEDLMPAR